MEQLSKDGQLVRLPELAEAETRSVLTEEAQRVVAPLFTIGAATREDAVIVAKAIAEQSIANEAIVLGDSCKEDTQPFRRTLGRYAIFVPFSCGQFARLLGADRQLLMRLAAVLFRYCPAGLILKDRHTTLGIVADRLLFLGRYRFPKRSDLYRDLCTYIADLGQLGTYDLANALAEPETHDSYLASDATGYWEGLLARPSSPEDRHYASICLNAYPSFLPKSTNRGEALWTCLANEWYDHGKILRSYIGFDVEIQINGKVQHGWQSGCGIDGERGYKPEAKKVGFPIYAWSRRNLEVARAEGFAKVRAIGAPFIYRDFGQDPGPADSKSLLCFPYHSIPEYRVSTDWRLYGENLLATARSLGFSSVTVCLHWHDYAHESTREAARSSGVEIVTLGHPESPRFMNRCVMLIREHAAVTSDRICTSGIYAAALNRPFFVSGEELKSDPPDPDVGLGADRKWIKKEMPEFLEFTGKVHLGTALRELGAEYKLSKEQLRQTLYGWCLP